MNKLAFALGVTTVVFASTTVLRACLAAGTGRAGRPPVPQIAQQSRASAVPSARSAQDPPADTATATKPTSPATVAAPDKARQLAMSRARLARLSDPQDRAEQFATLADMFRSNFFRVAKTAGWSRDDLDRVTAAMAERTLQRKETRLRCEVAPPCFAEPDTPAARKEADHQTLVQLLGEELSAFAEMQEESLRRIREEIKRLARSDSSGVRRPGLERQADIVLRERGQCPLR